MTTLILYTQATGAIHSAHAADTTFGGLNPALATGITALYDGSQTNISQLSDIDPWKPFKVARAAYLARTDWLVTRDREAIMRGEPPPRPHHRRSGPPRPPPAAPRRPRQQPHPRRSPGADPHGVARRAVN